MHKQEFSKLIEKYKKDECSTREKELLDNYLGSFQNKYSEWKASEMGDKRIVDEKIFSQIMQSLDEKKNNYFAEIIFSPALLKRAASIAFLLIMVTGLLYVFGVLGSKTGESGWLDRVTGPGEISTFTLSDGSEVTLNADSKLRYPLKFGNESREIYLEGEAYFKVSHNTGKPFIVHSENLSTQVLGTKFSISAFPVNNTITVSLLEGSVKVSKSNEGISDEIAVLKPKQQLLYNKEKNMSFFEQFDSLKVVGWKDNIYKFENEPLGKVIVKLERAFGVKFKFTDQHLLSQRVTMKFEKDSIQTVVNVIKSLTGLDYEVVKGNGNKEKYIFRNAY